MKVIGIHTKYRVIELFLTGYTLDEIVEQLDVSKGSVVTIVLSWDKVNTVHAILKDELNKTGAGERDIDEISREIAVAGSLAVHIIKKQSKIR